MGGEKMTNMRYVRKAFLTSKKRGPSCPNWGDGGEAMSGGKKTIFF